MVLPGGGTGRLEAHAVERAGLGGAVQPLLRVEVHRGEVGVLHPYIQILAPDVHGHPEPLVRSLGGFFVGLQRIFQQVHQQRAQVAVGDGQFRWQLHPYLGADACLRSPGQHGRQDGVHRRVDGVTAGAVQLRPLGQRLQVLPDLLCVPLPAQALEGGNVVAQVMPEGSDLLAVPPQVFVVLLCQLSPLEEQTFLGSAPGLTSEEVDQSGQNACGHGQRGTLPQKEARQAVLEARRKSLNLLNLFPE